jgi:sulfotransferase family protein
MSMTQRAWRTLPAPAKNAAKAMWSGYAWLTSRGRVLPDFLIIGTQRGGTTSLYKYLVQHPNLSHALTKEIRFFDLNYHRGLPWYRSRFPSRRHREMSERRRGAGLMVGEASPDYLFHPLAPARVAHDLPQAKLIVLLRNPIDRAFSHYWHQFKRGHETLTFAAAIDAEPDRLAGELDKILADPSYVSYERHHHSYLARGIYVDQLAAWMELIPRDRFLIERSEDLFQDPRAVFRRVLEFLGLPDHDLTEYETFNAFSSGEMEPALRARLVEYFRPHNQRLEAMLGRALGWDA